jgi:hypothetical protein
MAIEVGKKKKETKLPKSLDLFFQFTIFLFVLVGASYFFMIFINARALDTKTQIEEQIKKKEAEIPEREELEKTAQEYFNLVEDFKTVVENHQVVSAFFDPFERIIHPKISVISVLLDVKNSEVSFMGEGENLVAVGQQFLILKNSEVVKEISLEQISLIEEIGEKKRVEFVFKIKIDPLLLNFNVEE